MRKLDMLEPPLDLYAEGQQAYHSHRALTENPYPKASYAAERWAKGWVREYFTAMKESAS